MKSKFLLFFVLAFLIVSFVTSILVNTFEWNGLQRSTAAVIAKDLFVHGFYGSFSFNEAVDIFADFHNHYGIFTGFVGWPPLQVFLLFFSILLFGTSKLSLSLIPFIFTTLFFVYLYKFAKLFSNNINVAKLTLIFCAVNFLIFNYSNSPMLEIPLAFFTIATFYYLILFFESKRDKHFYYSLIFFSLGIMSKLQFLIILPSILLIVLSRKNLNFFLSKNNRFYLVVSGFLLIILLTSPLLAQKFLLYKLTSEWDVTSFPLIDKSLSSGLQFDGEGYLSGKDFYYQNTISDSKIDLISHRYDLPFLKKFWIMTTSLFSNLFLIPFFFLGILGNRKKFKFNTAELFSLSFILVTFFFFSFHGGVPRYMIPSIPFTLLFVSKGLFLMEKKWAYLSFFALILISSAQSINFTIDTYGGITTPSSQHNSRDAALFIVSDSQGTNSTVITSRVQDMHLYFAMVDKERCIVVRQHPQSLSELEEFISGNYFPRNDLNGNMASNYLSRQVIPPVNYLVVHEGYETGSIKGSLNYNLKGYAESSEKFILVKVIESQRPNSSIFIFKKKE